MKKYFLAEDTIDIDDLNALADWLRTNPRLTMGQLTEKFEAKWSKWLGRKYTLYCNSGSSANLLMFAALEYADKLKNKKVIVPSVGWPTTISPAIQFGWQPIMCEPDPDTFGLDMNHLESLLRRHRPDSVIMVQVLGVPHKMDELAGLQNRYGFHLLEDACASMGSSYKSKKVGTFGHMSSFSLYFGHQISTIEGGLISTDDKKFYDVLRMIRSHGWTKNLDPLDRRKLALNFRVDNFNEPFLFVLPGYNFRPTDDHAFLGIRQIDKMDWLINRRSSNHSLYSQLLGDRFRIQKQEPNSTVCSIHFGLLGRSVRERKKIIKACDNAKIETRMFSAGNLGLHPFWYERYGKFHSKLADKIHSCGLFLPNNPTLSEKDIGFIAQTVLNSVKED